ncbi:MAG: site-specific DNA-methyltransferase [Victivallales bacterium]|nr:site-specific DNA-methyltransferase [Victivallales bacterium]
MLKALLGGEIERRQTYYKFTWNGKEEARAYARVPSMGTLRPCVEESSGRDGTPGVFDSDNLYIEGDNLEVLKLLQGPYHKKVKMIYIDPPYNTGKDFVYPDNYRDSLANYKSLTGQTNAEGVATRANPETSGRYHTDWLNMMYPRLILARTLLADDGVLFISIDDSEQDNLKKLCNEVFGEENFVAQLVWERAYAPKNDARFISNSHDYVIMFAKSIEQYVIGRLPRTEEANARYSNPDNDPRGVWKASDLSVKTYNAESDYPITLPSGRIVEPPTGRCWRLSQKAFLERLQDNRIWFGPDGNSTPAMKRFLTELKFEGMAPTSIMFYKDVGHSQEGAQEVTKLLNAGAFDGPKPARLLSRLLTLAKTKEDSIVLDFFSGSATTAHAVMQLNAEDGGHRKFIMVQLPEVCEAGTEAAKAGYKNICEIGKERIRRAGKKIAEENATTAPNLDIGFKVFKLDTSNFIPWNPEPDKIELLLRNSVENILVDRTRQDLLYEVLLKCNLPLTLPIEERKVGENTVYVVGEGALAICLDTRIPQTIADEIVRLRDEFAPSVPMQVVFRDNGFTDVAKTNALQILKQAGFEEKSVQTI